MSKRTGNRNGRAAKKRRTRHTSRAIRRWHALNAICERCGADYPRGRTHYHSSDGKGGWYSWSIDRIEGRQQKPFQLFDEGVTYTTWVSGRNRTRS